MLVAGRCEGVDNRFSLLHQRWRMTQSFSSWENLDAISGKQKKAIDATGLNECHFLSACISLPESLRFTQTKWHSAPHGHGACGLAYWFRVQQHGRYFLGIKTVFCKLPRVQPRSSKSISDGSVRRELHETYLYGKPTWKRVGSSPSTLVSHRRRLKPE